MQLNQPVLASANGTDNCYAKLTQISYLPIQETIAIQFYYVAKPGITPAIQQKAQSNTENAIVAAGAIYPSSPKLVSGQAIKLWANASSGIRPYLYQWYSGSSASCDLDNAIAGQNNVSYSVAPTNSTHYCYKVSDLAGVSNTSATDLVSVSPAALTPVQNRWIVIPITIAVAVAATLLILFLAYRDGKNLKVPWMKW